MRLELVKPIMTPSEFDVIGDNVTLGRGQVGDQAPDIMVAHPSISRNHVRLCQGVDGYTIEDLRSTNKTWVNGNLLLPGNRAHLSQHSYIQLGEVQFLVNYPEGGVFLPPEISAETERSPVAPTGRFEIGVSISVGRDSGCDIVLRSPQIASRHALLEMVDGIAFVRDLGTVAGTFLNGEQIDRPTPVKRGDTIMVGMTKLQFDGRSLVRFDEQGAVRIDALRLTRSVIGSAGPICLLRDCSLQIRPQELVAIVGPTGAGKSTLLNILSGYASTTGEVRYNGWDLSTSRSAFASSIGYVPQPDIIHDELTVYEVLDYAARLRLSPDISDDERRQRVEEVMLSLDIAERHDVLSKKLSGGQRKRLNIGVELLSEPSVLFLDEPAAGLDPYTEAQLMQLLRRSADSGRTVVMVTHATQSLEMVDLMVVMGPGGHVGFVGTPEEACRHFQCSDYAAIYGCVYTEEQARIAGEDYVQSEFHQKYVQQRLGTELPAGRSDCGEPSAVSPERPCVKPDSLRQFLALCQRYVTIISRDSRYMALLLLQAPIITLIIVAAMKFDRYLLVPKMKSFEELLSISALDILMPKFLAFLLVVSMLWLGVSNSARELVKERSIFRRERMVSLSVPAYLASKCAVLAIITAVQVGLMLAALSLLINLEHAGFRGIGRLFWLLFWIGMSGCAMGLAVSSLVSSTDQAASLIPLLMLPQLAMCGAMVPMDQPGLRQASYAVIAKWGYQGVVDTLGIAGYYQDMSEIGSSARELKPAESVSPDRDKLIAGLRAEATHAQVTPYFGGITIFIVLGIAIAGVSLVRRKQFD